MYAFEYHRPQSVADAAKLLASNSEAKLLAGGHTLLPTMKQRLAAPKAIVDLARVAELKGTGAGKDGVFRHAAAEAALGKGWSAQSLKGLATDAGKMMSDIHADAAYRAHLVGVMAGRAVAKAG